MGFLRRLSYANVMATLAFFVAVGGTTMAAVSIDGGDIEPGTVKGKALKNATVPGSKLKANSIRGAQVLESDLGEVPSATRADSAISADTAQTAATAQRATTADSATTATTAGDSATVGGLSAATLTDDCPAGTRLYAGACFETSTRTAATWFTAAEICGDAGRRIPTLAELEGFRQEPGVTLGSGEWSTSLQDGDGTPLDSDGFVVITMNDSGTISSANDHDEGFAPYRCVGPLSNR